MVDFLLIFVPPLLLLELAFSLKALGERKRASLIADRPVTPVAELADGPVQLRGWAVPLGEPLTGPLSDRPCVCYRFRVEKKVWTIHPVPHPLPARHWKTIINDFRRIPTGLHDDSGVIAVDLRRAKRVLKPGPSLRSDSVNDAPPALEQHLKDRYRKSSKGLFFNPSMRYFETPLYVADEIVVLGEARRAPEGDWQIGKGKGPFLVSNRTPEELIVAYRRSAARWWVAVALTAAVPALLLAVFRGR